MISMNFNFELKAIPFGQWSMGSVNVSKDINFNGEHKLCVLLVEQRFGSKSRALSPQ